MEPFLQTVANHLIKTFPNELDKLCVVLPNRRAGLFFRKYLAEGMQPAAIWSPAIFSVEDFFTELSGWREQEPLMQLVDLYKVFTETASNQSISFEQFLDWAPQLLKDFDDADQNLADPKSLFLTLSEARAISLWNPDGRPLTPFQQQYLQFFNSLFPIHQTFCKSLLVSNTATRGMIFRAVAENINKIADNMAWKYVIFAGFNALTRAEEKVMGVLHQSGKAVLLWDGDEYYMEDHLKEAGYYLRQWQNKWNDKEFRWKGGYFKAIPHQVRISGLSDAVGQARYCGHLLAQLIEQGVKPDRIALILLDAGLLPGVLNSIPESITEVNITGGFSLKQSGLVLLLEELFSLHSGNFRRDLAHRTNQAGLYKNDLLRILSNSYLRMMAELDQDSGSRILENSILKVRSFPRQLIAMTDLFPAQDEPVPPFLELLSVIFIPWSSSEDVLQWLRKLLTVIRQCIVGTLKRDKSFGKSRHIEPNLALELEILSEIEKITEQLGSVFSQFNTPPDLQVFLKLYRHLILQKSLPFSGEALKGLQIMGLLESRALDFDYIIILSCNDDILPGSKIASSFIPPDIRYGFGLPTHRQQDAVQAYHFYRLLQRSSSVWLLHGTQAGHFGGGEPSRFLRQLQLELPLYSDGSKVEDQIVTLPFTNPGFGRKIDIPKSGPVLEQLEAKALKGFSASSLNKYRDCPLRFYYSELAGIKEKSEFMDTIDAPTLGTAVHNALFELYSPLLKSRLTVPVISALTEKSQQSVIRAFESIVPGGMDMTTGKNLLLLNVAGLLVNRMILFDAALAKEDGIEGNTRELWFLEQSLESVISIPYQDSYLTIRLKGTLDRVEKINGIWSILDYKTGKVEDKNMKINDWDSLISNSDLNIAFQLLFYNHLLRAGEKGTSITTAGVLPLKKLSTGNMILKIPVNDQQVLTDGIDATASQKFDNMLIDLLLEIFALDLPFSQTPDSTKCTHCPYINLCGR